MDIMHTLSQKTLISMYRTIQTIDRLIDRQIEYTIHDKGVDRKTGRQIERYRDEQIQR